MQRRTWITALGCLGWAAWTAATPARADDYPSRPITVIVGFSAGSATDTAARAISKKLSERLKVPVVIDNKPGAATMIAVSALRRSAPDGYTLMLASGSTLAQIPGVQSDVGYDPLKDFTPVAPVLKMLGVLVVSPELPVSSTKDLAEYARKQPGRVTYATSGMGSTNHLAMELMNARTGTQMLHVPFKGDNQVSLEIMAGRVDAAFQTIAIAMPHVKAGKLKALAVTTTAPVSVAPGIPTLAQAGIPGLTDLDPYSFAAFVGPVGLPEAMVRKVNEAVNDVLSAPDLVAQLADMGFVPMPDSPEGLRSFIASEVNKWKQLGLHVAITPPK